MRGRGVTYRICKRIAINVLIEQMCDEEAFNIKHDSKSFYAY